MINGQSLTVIGVAPRGFEGTTLGARPDIFIPITMRNVTGVEMHLGSVKASSGARSGFPMILCTGLSVEVLPHKHVSLLSPLAKPDVVQNRQSSQRLDRLTASSREPFHPSADHSPPRSPLAAG